MIFWPWSLVLPHISFQNSLNSEENILAKWYPKVLRHNSARKMDFPLSYSWSYSTVIFDNGSPCTDLFHQPFFRMRRYGAYLKWFPMHSDWKLLASFILFSLPRLTLCLTPGLMNPLSVTLLLFSRCVYFDACNYIRTDLEYPRRALRLKAAMARPALHRILRSIVVEHQSAESEDLGLDYS